MSSIILHNTCLDKIRKAGAKQERFSITQILSDYEKLLVKIKKVAELDDAVFCTISTHFNQSMKVLCRIQKAAKSGNDKKARNISQRYFASFSTRIVATLKVIADREGSKLSPAQLNLAALEKKANQINSLKGTGGSAKIKVQHKSASKKRYVLSPCSNLRASDHILCNILKATGQRSLIDFNRLNKGRNRAALKIKNLVENGYRYWLIFDLENCYPSIGLGHLQGTNLPKEMLKTGVFWNSYVHMKDIPDATAESAVRLGLPPGATASGILAGSFIEGQVAPLLGSDQEGLSCVDDVAIGACSLAGLEKVAKAIKDQFTNHTAGPLTFKKFGIYDVRKGMSFLNYRFFHSGDLYPDDCMVFPDKEAKNNFRYNIFRMLDDLEGKTFEKKTQRIESYVDNWIKGHSVWQPTHEQIYALQSEALILISEHGTILSLKHAPPLKSFP